MEESLNIVFCQFETIEKRNKAVFFLSESTRPEFEDDVLEKDLSLFYAVDEAPFAKNIQELNDTGLYFEYEGDTDEPVIPCDELGAKYSMTVTRVECDGLDYNIIITKNNEEPVLAYATIEYDDIELDAKVEEFQQALENVSGIQLIRFLEEYLDKHGSFPFKLEVS